MASDSMNLLWKEHVILELGVDNEGNKTEEHQVSLGPKIVETREYLGPATVAEEKGE